jgi:hypothetical protein
MNDRARLLQDTRAARDQAAALLKALQDAKGVAESHPSPKGDLYKRVTGASSLDNALAETRRSIDAYDRLIAQIEKGEDGSEMMVRARQLAAGAANT